MKTRLAILAVLAATAGISTGASANDILAPVAPGIGQEYDPEVPVLFPSEQGAFKGLEVATQVVEASIQQKGCDEAEYDLNVSTNKYGKGEAKLDGVVLEITPLWNNSNGRMYKVLSKDADLLVPNLDDLIISKVDASGTYNIGSGMQELTTTLEAGSKNEGFDIFRGTIIKDYARIGLQSIPDGFQQNGTKKVSTVVDYGYQQIQKNWYIAAKYWQQSQTWRQNGARAGTWWVKTRVAPEGDCTIEVKLQGTNGKANQDNLQGFNETGTITVNKGQGTGIGGVDYAK